MDPHDEYPNPDYDDHTDRMADLSIEEQAALDFEHRTRPAEADLGWI